MVDTPCAYVLNDFVVVFKSSHSTNGCASKRRRFKRQSTGESRQQEQSRALLLPSPSWSSERRLARAWAKLSSHTSASPDREAGRFPCADGARHAHGRFEMCSVRFEPLALFADVDQPAQSQWPPHPRSSLFFIYTTLCCERRSRSAHTTSATTSYGGQSPPSGRFRYPNSADLPIPLAEAVSQNETDPAKLAAFYDERAKELAVLKRSAIVNQLYGGWKLVVEKEKPVHERSDS